MHPGGCRVTLDRMAGAARSSLYEIDAATIGWLRPTCATNSIGRLAVYSDSRDCWHTATVNVDAYADDIFVPGLRATHAMRTLRTSQH